MRPGPSLLLQHSDLQPVPPLFPWFLITYTLGVWEAAPGIPQLSPKVIVLPILSLGSIAFGCWHLSGLSLCPAELVVQWPVIIKILITIGVDYEQSYFLGLERPAEFNK